MKNNVDPSLQMKTNRKEEEKMSDQSQIRVRVRVSYLAVANDGEGEAAPSRSRSADLKNRFGLDNRCGQRTIRRGGDLTCFVGAPAT
jgi:hypothetical protein